MELPFACVSGLVDSCVYEDVGSTAAFHTLGTAIKLCLSLFGGFSKVCKPSIALKSTKIYKR